MWKNNEKVIAERKISIPGKSFLKVNSNLEYLNELVL